MITKTFLLEKKKLGQLKGDAVKEDTAISEKESSKEVQQIEQSKNESRISSPIDEVLVVPYQNLASVSDDIAETRKLFDKLVVVKFNDTLGTTMGFNGPKSAIEVFNGSTPLDLLVNQIESINLKYGCHIPLVLLNTTRTHDDTLKGLNKYSKSNVDIHPLNQGQLTQQEALDGRSIEDELNTSDHAAVFLSLMKSGILDVLLSQGKEYVHVVSSDNMAVAIDPKILNHLIQNKIEYCMEVTPTASNYLNSTVNQCQGKFKLMEITQNPSKHSMEKYKFVDTRSLWVDLKAIKRLVDTDTLKDVHGNKTLLRESAAGSAIWLFAEAIGINVPQSRFLPLNSTSDLLLLQSDLYASIEEVLVRNTAGAEPMNPSINLGPEFEKIIDFQRRFKSIPSIIQLDSLNVTGDVWFGAGVTLKGRVNIVPKPGMKLEIPDGAVLENQVITNPADI